MPSILDLLVRSSGNLTPRLSALKRERDLEDLNFQEGERPDIELPNVDSLPVREAGIISRFFGPDVTIESGKAESGESSGWYEVRLEEDFSVVHSVVAVSEHRSGSFDTASFSPPTHDSPDFEQGSTRPSFTDRLEDAFKSRSRDMGENLFNEGRNAIINNVPDAGVDLDGSLVDMWDDLVTRTYGAGSREAPGEGAVESIFGSLGALIGDAMEDGFGDKAREIENAINNEVDLNMFSYNSTIESANSDLSSQAETAINDSQKLLYSSLGMPEGALMSPVQIRNVDTESFEFLGYEGGMTIQYTAVGSS